jgi:biopolymer transport protein ExbD
MRPAAIAAVVVLGAIGCKDRDADPAPAPVHRAADPGAPCEIAVTLTSDRLSWTEGQRGGDGVDLRDHVDPQTVASMVDGIRRDTGADCTALVTSGAGVSYQAVVTVLDALITAGFPAGLDVPGGDPMFPLAAPHAPARRGLGDAPVVVITTTLVAIAGAELAKVDDPDIETKIAAALEPAHRAAPAAPVLLQADRDCDYGVILRVITGAKAAGYADVLFAVKPP